MIDDDIMGLIEKDIVISEFHEPDEQTSSFDEFSVETKSASVGKETKSISMASREPLQTGMPHEFEPEVAYHRFDILI